MSVDSIRARHAAATPGPWRYDGNSLVETIPEFDLHRFDTMGETVAKVELDDADGEFISHAPTDMAALLDALDAVTAIHSQAHKMISADPNASEYERGFDDSTRGLSAKILAAIQSATGGEQ